MRMSESEANNSMASPAVAIDENNSTVSYGQKCLNVSHTCGNHILLVIYRFLSDCLICRLISFIFTLQAGVMWLGCK
jgi:hypothetical protein